MPEPTTSPASMGGPLSEAERLAEIRRSLKMAKMASANAPGTFWHTFTENAEFLLELVGVLEGQLATAREESTELGARLKEFLADQFRIARDIESTQDKGEQQRLLGLAEARATLRAMLDGCDDFMVSRVRACTGCGKCDYCTARGITAASVLGLDGGDPDA